jgi:alpha-beta hydrolase superfamily lysophospholipase/SAM-dependent methyltransferase
MLQSSSSSLFVPQEAFFTASNGVELFYRAWIPSTPFDKAMLLFHRGHEHSGRWQDFVERLNLPATAIFAWDARGHGKSPGERGYAEGFATIVRDVDAFARFISTKHNVAIEDMAVVAHSVGAVAVAAWVHDYAPRIRAMVLATPAFRVKLYVPLAIPALRAQMKVRKKAFVTSYVRASMITHDPEQVEAYNNDPLISKQIAVNLLLDLHDISTRLVRDAGAIITPTLVLTAGSDWVVKNSATTTFVQRLSSPMKELAEHPGFGHAIFHETDRDQPVDTVRRFLRDAFERSGLSSEDTTSKLAGYTRREFDRLSRPLSLLNPRRWSFAIQKLVLNTIGKCSDGIRLGWQSGFNSGESLDYVYRNAPSGRNFIGRLIDKQYLGAIGWCGVRIRKQLIQSLLRGTIGDLIRAGKTPILLDIASGPGRYMLELLNELKYDTVRALLRDRSTTALEQGRALAASLGLSNVSFEPGNAFDRASIASIDPKPNIAIVSGLYELFPDNEMVRESLGGLADVLQADGYLIYTGQPWHPQLEMIARVLTHGDGSPWIMRRRTQRDLDELVRAAGFEKNETRSDGLGLFTVSLARKL